MSVSAAIQTNHSKIEAVVRTENLAIALRRSSHGKPRRTHGKCIEKLTSCNHHLSLLLVCCRAVLLLQTAVPMAGKIDCDQHEMPAFVKVFLSPSMLMRVDASGVPAPRQWVSRLSP